MIILVVNCGSSSVKCQLIETCPEKTLARMRVEGLGGGETTVVYDGPEGRRSYAKPILEHQDALQEVLRALTQTGLLRDPGDIAGVGHRVVHGGETLTESTVITAAVEEIIKQNIELAPLHNPANLRGYHAAQALLPKAVQVAVFDTAFHETMPPAAYTYGLPHDYYTRYRIRRYGFHGTSHRFVSQRFAEIHHAPPADFKLITCHLGNGCSICAIDGGRSVDTSMGFTPLEGLLMGTRCGDIDPAVILYIMARENMGVPETDAVMNWRGGLLGISGISNDMRTLVAARQAGDARAALAIDTFCYRLKKYISAYQGVLNGAGAVVFTGGIGEHQPLVRELACAGLDALGIRIDPEKNRAAVGVEAGIGAAGASTSVWVIPTNEELLIAQDTARCILGARRKVHD
jgi:acetate kinase